MEHAYENLCHFPVYKNQETIGQVVAHLKPYGLPCYLVNHGISHFNMLHCGTIC